MERFEAQLAGVAKGGMADFAAHPERYTFEEKFDGIRALVQVADGKITILNRRGENKGRGLKNPWLTSELQRLVDLIPDVGKGTVLDGELVADTWNQTMHELAHGGDGLRFVVFDLPFLFGQDLRGQKLSVRRQLLEKLFEAVDSQRVVLSQKLPYREDLAERIWVLGGEGIVAKSLDAPYECGGRKFWFKIKEERTAEAWICGFTPGKGKYAGQVGAVKLCQLRDGKAVEVTQISGMDDAQRAAFSDADIGRVVEFKYQLRTEGSYRHPRWLRWRDDKTQAECTWEATE